MVTHEPNGKSDSYIVGFFLPLYPWRSSHGSSPVVCRDAAEPSRLQRFSVTREGKLKDGKMANGRIMVSRTIISLYSPRSHQPRLLEVSGSRGKRRSWDLTALA